MISLLNIIILAVFVLLGLIFLKLEHHGRKIKLAVLILIGLLIYFSIANLFISEQVDLTSPKGIIGAVYVYFGWLGQTASKLWGVGKDTVVAVGNAIKFNVTS